MKVFDGERAAELTRSTKETEVYVGINLDGEGSYEIDTGSPAVNHMLEQLSLHSGFDLVVKARGDVGIDMHHTLEDIGITMGRVLLKCLGKKLGIRRYGSIMLPMDDSLCMASVDLCGRANLVYNCSLLQGRIGDFDAENIKEFFKALVSNSFITLHINLMYGDNLHHNAECIFKATARSLKEAVSIADTSRLPSTKGCL